jgi:hypothetical protein
MTRIEHVQGGIDGALSGVALSSPLWLQYLENLLGITMLVGGVLLLAIRIAIAWKTYKNLDKKKGG